MIKTFKEILQTMFNAVVGSTLSDFNIGSVTRTVLEAVASAIEEAYMYLYKFVLKFFISTSEGEWLDRRLEDLGMTRKLGSMAFGIITIGRDAASPIGISIPVGTVFEADNGAQFATTELATLPVGGISVNVSARAVAKGSNANLAAGTELKQIGVAISGIDWAKVVEMTGGMDDETDEEYRNRVPAYFESLGRATEGAIKYAAMTVSGVTGVTVRANYPTKGWFTVYLDSSVDDTLLAAVKEKIDEYRGFCIQYTIERAVRVGVDIKMSINVLSGSDEVLTRQGVITALTDLVANLEMGEPLYIATIIQTAMNVAGVENVKLTEPTTDTVPEENEILQPDSVEVTVL